MKRTLIKEALALGVGQQVTLGGWVRTVRNSKGGFSFIALYDGSCFGTIQIVADGKLPNYESDVVKLGTGSSLWVSGTLVASQGKGQKVELQATEIRVLGKADPGAYPIQQKQTTFEFLRTQAHLRARTNTFGAVARVRNVICWAIHQFFQERGFVYLHTPIVTASDCEGAGQMFRVSTLDFENPPRNPEGKIDYSQDFFGKSTYLTVSGQLEGETYACALGNIYTFGPTFRAENSNTPRHLAEFWMIEPEMAFCDLAGDADLAEAFLKHIFRTVLEKCPDDMAFFNERIDKTVIDTLTHIADSGFERLTYTQAVELLKKSGKTWEFPVDWGTDLQTEHERHLTEQVFKKPVILMDYPAKIKAFYMRLNDDADRHGGQPTVAAMDVLVPKIGEIIGGSQREERLDMLEKRMMESGLKKEDYWWYLDLRRFGSVPHAGFGLGLERAIQFCTGMANIRDVIPYPRAPRSAEF
jgi:asparaginyl-tRNA synthetase